MKLSETLDNATVHSTLFFDNALSALKSASPEGSTVCLVGFDRADIFLRAGYRLVERDGDVAIARGGEREFNAARKTNCAKLILAPTHGYLSAASAVYRTVDHGFAKKSVGAMPYAAVFDSEDIDPNLASVFGEIIALDLCAFDSAFGSLMRGEKLNISLCTEVARMVTDVTAALRPIEKTRTEQSKTLVAFAQKAASIVAAHPELAYSSGACQLSEAYRMLCTAEDRPLGMRGETEAVLGDYVLDFYVKSFGRGATFPPDNNRRIDSLCTYFNADVRRACVHTTPIAPPQNMRLMEYRLNEYKPELVRLLVEAQQRKTAARQVFRRLYPDDGYCLKSLVDKTDIPLLLALAPDVFAADSMLSYIKQTGNLERYIV